MKLTCDLCGGELQMQSGGQNARCGNCGITYSIERLKEKLAGAADVVETTNDVEQDTVFASRQSCGDAETMRNLHIRRKVDLFLCKAAVIIDGQQCAILSGPRKETIIPVAAGTHTISFRVASANGITEMDELTFQVKENDWYVEFGLHRGAFKASYKCEMQEM